MEGLCFGDFQVKKKIAEGGMGQIYLAKQVSLDRDVALKILPERFAKDSSFKARFEREAREAARLNHPNIISVYAYGIKDGIPYFAMEYVEGKDLSQLLKERGKFPVQEALRVTKEVAKALEVAHKKGVVHRDIKPSNIMIKEDGSIKVTDFGLAKAIGSKTMVTQAFVILGTPHYMSPEQGKGEKLDVRSDIYSLGVVLYELLTGGVPFHSDTPTSLIYMHVHETPPPIREKNPEVPPAVEALVMRMLTKDPNERFQTPAELIKAIEAVESGVTVAHTDSPMTLEIGIGSAPTLERVTPKKETKSMLLLVVILILIIGGAGVAVFFFSEEETPNNVVTPVPITVPEEEPKTGEEQPPKTPLEQSPVERTSPDVEEKIMVNFPAAAILAKLPIRSRLFIRRAGEPKDLDQPLLADKEFEVGLYIVTAKREGYEPIVHNFNLRKEGIEPPPDSVSWEFELSDELKEALRRARLYMAEQKFSLALDELKRVLEKVPDFKEVHELQSECEHRYAIYKKTTEDFNEAKRLIRERKWKEALAVLKSIPTDFKDYTQNVLPLIEKAEDELQKEARFKNYLDMANEKLRKGELESAQDYIQSADLIIPGMKEVAELRECIHRLRNIRSGIDIEMERKNFERAYKLTVEFLKVASESEKILKRQRYIESELNRIAEVTKQFENRCSLSEEKMEKAPEEALLEAVKAKEAMSILRDRYRKDVSNMSRRVSDLIERAETRIAEKQVKATIKRMDSLFLSGRLNELLTMVDPQNTELRERLKKQLSDFLLSRMQVVLSEHIVKRILLSSLKDVADVECSYRYDMIHPESGVELKGKRERRIKLIRRNRQWFIADIR